MPLRLPVVACAAALLLAVSLAHAENWPGWRGPRGDGSSDEKGIVTQWDGASGRNIAWKTPLPGKGHASAIVWNDRIFTVSCREDDQARLLLCLDRPSGRLLWEKSVLSPKLERKHRLNSFASSTPATDGGRVYISFLDVDQMFVAAYDFAGQQLWAVHPGVFASVHGYCSSPVLFENLVIVNGDHDGESYILALDRDSGRTVWKTPRENHTRSYCAPLIRQIDGRTQLIFSGDKCVSSFDPRTGRRHWVIQGPTEQYVASLVYNGKLLFLTAGFPEKHILAIRPDGSGDVTDTHIVWRTTKGASYVPSPIVSADGRYFLVVSDDGLASCFEAATGQRHWMERIGRHYSASLVQVEGLIHFLADDGTTTIVRPGPEFTVVQKNELGENCYASPAVSHGYIYQRGEKHLYAIGPVSDSK